MARRFPLLQFKNPQPQTTVRAAPQYQPILRELGIDAESVFLHPLIHPWRRLADRENCVLQTKLEDGTSIRWHVKRYAAVNYAITPMEHEVEGHLALEKANIPTAQLVAFGRLADRRSFVIFNDLTGYSPLDKLIAGGEKFESLLEPTAQLAAQLHNAGLHHRDLYLCHFMGRQHENGWDLHLIDVARVKRLPKLFRQRWIVKDVAQFMYSTNNLPITAQQRQRWLDAYSEFRGFKSDAGFRNAVVRKRDWIARHDEELKKQQPHRNVSIPT